MSLVHAIYMFSMCILKFSSKLFCPQPNETHTVTLCPTSTSMKLGPCATASNPCLFFAGITVAYHFVRPGFHIRYTLKLSAAVQNRSPTPAICPSYANPVVSIVPKQLSVNLRPGNAMFFADFYPSLGWNSELPTILWFTPIFAAEKNVAEYHICTAWIWLEYSLLWLNCPNFTE